MDPGTRYAILTTQGAPKPAAKTGKMPTQEELDQWERVIPIMNELLQAKGLKKTAEGAALVTGIKGPLEEGWQMKLADFAGQIMSSLHSQTGRGVTLLAMIQEALPNRLVISPAANARCPAVRPGRPSAGP